VVTLLGERHLLEGWQYGNLSRRLAPLGHAALLFVTSSVLAALSLPRRYHLHNARRNGVSMLRQIRRCQPRPGCRPRQI
jgi:membrane-associated phospholipid phosphatase